MPTHRRESEENKSRRRQQRGATLPADWESVDPTLLGKVIAAVSGRGGAIRFGYTRDGGAYAIGYLGDGDPYTEYLRPTDDISKYLEGVIEDWKA